MIWTLAPVAFSKSRARRCSGSAIWGPVNVTTRTVTPLNFWPELVFEPLAQAAIKPTPTTRPRAFARCRLMSIFSPLNPTLPLAPAQVPKPLNMGCLTRSGRFVKPDSVQPTALNAPSHPMSRLFGASDSTVDDEARCHHELRFVGGQKKRRLGDIFRPAQVVAQLSLADRGHPFFWVRVGLLQVALDKSCEDSAGQQGVDAD